MGKQEDHNYAQTRGSQASIFEQWMEQQNLFRNEHEIKGFEHGVNNQPQTKSSFDWLSETIEATINLLNPFSGGNSWHRRSPTVTSQSTYAANYTTYGDGGSGIDSQPMTPKSTNWPLWIILGISSLPLILVLLIIAVGVGVIILTFWAFFRVLEEMLN